MDVRIDSEVEHFKFRVAGILEHNGKYLFVKMDSNNFYCLPGGHVEIGESTDKAVCREMEEELGFKIIPKKLLGIGQNFYTKNGKVFHELGYYYLVNAKNADDVNPENYVRTEIDKGVLKYLEFIWLKKEDLDATPFRPAFVKELLSSDSVLNIVNIDGKECKITKFWFFVEQIKNLIIMMCVNFSRTHYADVA